MKGWALHPARKIRTEFSGHLIISLQTTVIHGPIFQFFSYEKGDFEFRDFFAATRPRETAVGLNLMRVSEGILQSMRSISQKMQTQPL